MPLPAALLIASLDSPVGKDILDVIGNEKYMMKRLSCECYNHASSPVLVPPCSRSSISEDDPYDLDSLFQFTDTFKAINSSKIFSKEDELLNKTSLVSSYNKKISVKSIPTTFTGKKQPGAIRILSRKSKKPDYDQTKYSNRILPISTGTSEKSSPIYKSGPQIPKASCRSENSLSYFSDLDSIEKIVYTKDAEPQTKADLVKSLCYVVDVLENIEARFNHSFLLKDHEVQMNPEDIKINQQGRDILDLGSNLRQSFPLVFAKPEKIVNNKYWPKILIKTQCMTKDCNFQEMITL